jgi:hypothetical protein
MKKSLLKEIITESARYMLYEQRFLNEEVSASLTKQEALDKIVLTKGKRFSVTFKKKNGQRRVMTAVTRESPIYQRALRGGELPYDAFQKGVIPVFDLGKNFFRMINIQGIETLKIGNDVFIVK